MLSVLLAACLLGGWFPRLPTLRRGCGSISGYFCIPPDPARLASLLSPSKPLQLCSGWQAVCSASIPREGEQSGEKMHSSCQGSCVAQQPGDSGGSKRQREGADSSSRQPDECATCPGRGYIVRCQSGQERGAGPPSPRLQGAKAAQCLALGRRSLAGPGASCAAGTGRGLGEAGGKPGRDRAPQSPCRDTFLSCRWEQHSQARRATGGAEAGKPQGVP